jgi:hypothetical protein
MKPYLFPKERLLFVPSELLIFFIVPIRAPEETVGQSLPYTHAASLLNFFLALRGGEIWKFIITESINNNVLIH